jgi:hypothetical protein
MAREQVTVFERTYEIRTSPDALSDDEGRRVDAFIDHADAIIWIDPRLSQRRRHCVELPAVSRAWRERLNAMPVVD